MTTYIGDIVLFGGNFAPDNFAMCNGQLLAVSQHDALFSLLGTMYGGDGRTTFGLPDLRGRVPIHAGTGPGLTNRRQGDRGGADAVTLQPTEIAPHSHSIGAITGTAQDPNTYVLAAASLYHADDGGTLATLDQAMVQPTPAAPAQAHENRQPNMSLNFWICLTGIYPSRH